VGVGTCSVERIADLRLVVHRLEANEKVFILGEEVAQWVPLLWLWNWWQG